jgi:hypothetical protein
VTRVVAHPCPANCFPAPLFVTINLRKIIERQGQIQIEGSKEDVDRPCRHSSNCTGSKRRVRCNNVSYHEDLECEIPAVDNINGSRIWWNHIPRGMLAAKDSSHKHLFLNFVIAHRPAGICVCASTMAATLSEHQKEWRTLTSTGC